jgi:hypothetical protein
MLEAPDYRRKRVIPTKYKSLIIIFCILGIFIHSFWNKKTIETLVVDEQTIMFQEKNMQSVVINFVIENKSDLQKKQKVRIEVIDQNNYLITSTIMYLNFKPGQNLFSKQVKFKQRYTDIKERELRGIVKVEPRKLLW